MNFSGHKLKYFIIEKDREESQEKVIKYIIGKNKQSTYMQTNISLSDCIILCCTKETILYPGERNMNKKCEQRKGQVIQMSLNCNEKNHGFVKGELGRAVVQQ